jgi:flagellar motility protein MotE (MotC chaperone)
LEEKVVFELEKQLTNIQEKFQIMEMQNMDIKKHLEDKNRSSKEVLDKTKKELANQTQSVEVLEAFINNMVELVEDM